MEDISRAVISHEAYQTATAAAILSVLLRRRRSISSSGDSLRQLTKRKTSAFPAICLWVFSGDDQPVPVLSSGSDQQDEPEHSRSGNTRMSDRTSADCRRQNTPEPKTSRSDHFCKKPKPGFFSDQPSELQDLYTIESISLQFDSRIPFSPFSLSRSWDKAKTKGVAHQGSHPILSDIQYDRSP
ncbi:hypothetical protein MRB53_026022 [Persea americana]|uniref:Uncharacterized protein n=1 Tax=Persea americana TaxID=3435 RepID=A0ACC2LGY1_PERAE|nr:hypothetical protein MRB53_026022 [Persea americana]